MALALPTPDTFPAFPYQTPYDIQYALMRHLYAAIEQKQHTVIESPTGTGKTLVLLTAGLSWLLNNHDRARKGELDQLAHSDSKEPAWVIRQTIERRRRELEEEDAEREQRLAAARAKEQDLVRLAERPRKRQKVEHLEHDVDDDEFLPDDEESGADSDDNISPAVRALMAKLSGIATYGKHSNEPEPMCTKVYYASRTHSQLSQVIPELRKLKLSTSGHPEDTSAKHKQTESSAKRKVDIAYEADDGSAHERQIRVVSLGSRKQLCINDDLRARATDLDEACRELLSEKGDKRCPYLPGIEDPARMPMLRDQILSSPKDIEELAVVGRAAHTCPYFGSRAAIPQAELVLLPYNLLLQKTAREALGIDVADQVVVIDEAHNLIPTLLSISSLRLPLSTLQTSLSQLAVYVTRFRTRLAARHLVHLKRLVAFLKALIGVVGEWRDAAGNGKDVTEVFTVGELVRRLGRKVGGINLLEIESYLRSSKIARKISGYSEKANDGQVGPQRTRKGATPPLHSVESLIVALTAASDDGRISLALNQDVGNANVEIRYQLLNPATHFKDVVDAARSVVLAGGTMSPMSNYVDQLFAHVASEKVSLVSVGHIVAAENLQCIIVSKGPRGCDFEFKFASRKDPAIIADLGQAIANMVNIVPAGMVVFFPSYAFLGAVKKAWEESGLLERMTGKKKIFYEPPSSAEVESVLREYAGEVARVDPVTSKKRGALLFAVIGAKLSEGLNFADDLARCVVVVGLPFANSSSPELQERMKYVNALEAKSGRKVPGAKDAAAELYENMCMNAVNQSIGRAIRHKDDWAALVLLDRRYAAPRIRNKLPKWIGEGTIAPQGFGQVVKEMSVFFRSRRGSAA